MGVQIFLGAFLVVNACRTNIRPGSEDEDDDEQWPYRHCFAVQILVMRISDFCGDDIIMTSSSHAYFPRPRIVIGQRPVSLPQMELLSRRPRNIERPNMIGMVMGNKCKQVAATSFPTILSTYPRRVIYAVLTNYVFVIWLSAYALIYKLA